MASLVTGGDPETRFSGRGWAIAPSRGDAKRIAEKGAVAIAVISGWGSRGVGVVVRIVEERVCGEDRWRRCGHVHRQIEVEQW